MNRLISLLRLPTREKTLFAEAVAFLFYAKLLLFVLPFKDCIKQFKILPPVSVPVDLNEAQVIGRAISRANKLAFWKNRCLVSSFAARLMLSRRNIASVLYLGLRFENDTQLKMNAHAWLMVGELLVTPKGSDGYKEIFRF
ncbi:lasso peptide biosynthesis B2 protein [Paludibacter jiangxiensis]|uniref:Transglutaminase-like superfamily protein n=1 Tax=Paludibacter jiangxiensis TaxID=681398 RepID=A0A171A1E1_9BACT|nr:lasso peptide biosynthesis B2 protein [Paludibacter jiangxiensis]GAT63210.1 transglutaminase-like superfamily protein [Paludibacter jiangxiensis]